MKGSLSKFGLRELSLLLIVLVCTTILLWTWRGTPLLTKLLLPKQTLQQLPEIHPTAAENQTMRSEYAEIHPTAAENQTLDSANAEIHPIAAENQTLDSTNSEIHPTAAENQTLASANAEIHPTAAENQTLASANAVIRPTVAEKQTLDSANAGCNYAKGKWVKDDRRPLYSGSGCKQWLSQMWACRLMQREDFRFEALWWEPKNCQMEEFEGLKFLKRMQNKTLAFVGDSLGRQQFQSLMCMVTGGKEMPEVRDVGKKYGFVTPKKGIRPSGWAYQFPSTNTTILYYWSACLCDLEPIDITNPATNYAMHLDQPPAFLHEHLHQIDVLVLNTGHHWNRGKLTANRWVMYVGGKPNTDKKLAMIGNAKNFTIHSIVKWVNSQLPKYPNLKAFYRSISPRHFVNGEWNTGGSCNNTTPMSIGKEVSQNESSDYSAGSAVKGTGVKLLDITALSQVRDEGHISRFSLTSSPGVQDCLHWCLPGVPDTWNEILFAQISGTS